MKKVSLAALLPLVFGLFIGCAGGGGGDDDDFTSGGGGSAGSCTAATYTPNYVGDQGGLPALQHWPAFPVRYGVIRDGSWNQLREDQAVDGFLRWVTRTRGEVQLVRDEGNPQITLQFVPQSQLGGQTIGIAESTYSPSTHEMVHVDIKVATELPNGVPMLPADTYATAMHEMGHALGIGVTGGHSRSDEDIMFACSTCAEGDISLRDLNTLLTAYCGTFSRDRSIPRSAGPTVTTRVECPLPEQRQSH